MCVNKGFFINHSSLSINILRHVMRIHHKAWYVGAYFFLYLYCKRTKLKLSWKEYPTLHLQKKQGNTRKLNKQENNQRLKTNKLFPLYGEYSPYRVSTEPGRLSCNTIQTPLSTFWFYCMISDWNRSWLRQKD